MATGVLVSYILGSCLQWDHLAYTSALFPAAMIAFLVPLPESPTWLKDHGKHIEASEALKWLSHKEKSNTDPDIFTIPQGMDEKETQSQVVLCPKTKQRLSLKTAKNIIKGRYTMEALTQRSVLIPFGLVVAILVFQQISGIDTVIFYTVLIFSSSNSSIDDYSATIIIGLVQVIATFISVFTIDKAGRRLLLIISGFFMGISMALLGTYFHIKEVSPETASKISLTPIVSLIIFMTSFSIGFCNIPFLLMGELLPLAQRSLLSSIAGSLNLGSMFLVIKTYPNIQQLVGDKGVFWLYALFSFASCIFVFAFLPETKKKTLEEIEEHFEMKNKKVHSSESTAETIEETESKNTKQN